MRFGNAISFPKVPFRDVLNLIQLSDSILHRSEAKRDAG